MVATSTRVNCEISEISKLESRTNPEWLEVDIGRPIRLTRKVLIPRFRYPNVGERKTLALLRALFQFNFIGKLLGYRGQTLKNLERLFQCHINILGSGSTKDPAKVLGFHMCAYVCRRHAFLGAGAAAIRQSQV